MELTGIKNIVFDLGGVLLNLDYNKTAEAFKKLGYNNFDAMYSQFKADELFEKLETGKVSEQDFFRVLQKAADKPITDEQLIEAWCAMLLDFRTDSLAYLATLSKKYNLYLLSNTNSIHFTAFHHLFKKQLGNVFLDDYFTKVYYSHYIGLRKPHKEVYEFIVKDAGFVPSETLFIDDSWPNLAEAEALGMKTHLLLPQERIEQLLKTQ
jgi:HAD superfamily hydrolase (TIGR01509 family)